MNTFYTKDLAEIVPAGLPHVAIYRTGDDQAGPVLVCLAIDEATARQIVAALVPPVQKEPCPRLTWLVKDWRRIPELGKPNPDAWPFVVMARSQDSTQAACLCADESVGFDIANHLSGEDDEIVTDSEIVNLFAGWTVATDQDDDQDGGLTS